MKILYVGVARSLWLFDLDMLNPKGLSWHPALEKVTARYAFAKAPKHLLDLDEAKHLVFLLGTFINSKNSPVEVNFTVYNNGISAETKSSTDDATEFLKDIAAFLANESGLVVPPAPYLKKGYVSQVDVECDTTLTALNPKLTPLFQRLNERVKTVDGKPRQFDLSTIQGWTEDVNQQMAPAMFKFERKVGSPFSSNHYFTQSALETQEHIDLLAELEKILTP